MSLLHFVHISDLHAREKTRLDLELRTEALLADLTSLGVKPDRVLFTGDLAFSGQAAEYALVQTLLLDPLVEQLGIERSQILVIPGNHDVDRSFTDDFTEAGLSARLTDSVLAEGVLEHPVYGQGRLAGYHGYVQSYFGLEPAIYRTHIVETTAGSVGFACLNSAWRCSGDADEGRLFLTRNQVLPAARALKECLYKIALVHHPLSWLHSSEQQETIPDLKREFDVILRGHLHASYSVKEQNAVTECVELACPALCDGRLPDVGYNLYTLDPETGKLTARFRRYFRAGNYFDQDNAYAKGGQGVFSLPTRTPIPLPTSPPDTMVHFTGGSLPTALAEKPGGVSSRSNPAPQLPLKPAQIVLSYVSRDEAFRREMRTRLTPLTQSGVQCWDASEIRFGANIVQERTAHFAAADIIVLLVTADYLADTNAYKEMSEAVQRQQQGQVQVVPVLVEPALWETAPFKELQVLPADKRPITEWPRRARAWNEVVQGIQRLVQFVQEQKASA